MLERTALVSALLGCAACSGNLVVGQQAFEGSPIGGGSSSGGPSPSGTGRVGTAGVAGTSTGAGTGNSAGSGATGNSAGAGTTTGGGSAGQVLGPVDAGYVFCQVAPSPGSDAGGERWMCPPGTYVCDLARPGNCFQCRNDGDCSNQTLPTYDPRRSRCDLDSGVPGYQGFCEECLRGPDCALGESCNLNRAEAEPQIVDVGFETCLCMPDSGALCPVRNCDPATCPLGATCHDDFGCGKPNPYCVGGQCHQCRNNADCAHLEGSGACVRGYCGSTLQCTSDADCAGMVGAQACLEIGGTHYCGCGSDLDCIGHSSGGRCDLRPQSNSYGNCGCQDSRDCAAGETCPSVGTSRIAVCEPTCDNGACPPGYTCDPTNACRSRCDPGYSCSSQEPVCDAEDALNRNSLGTTWCYGCLEASDCLEGEACTSSQQCGSCNAAASCRPGEICGADLTCHASCEDSSCPAGESCDFLGLVGAGALCYECLTAGDCPGHEGCDHKSHTCGTCEGLPEASQDCRPGDLCSNYWPDPSTKGSTQGVCLDPCDLSSCPADMPICSIIPSLTSDHRYCVGCLFDSDCLDAGPGAWCDVSINFTFQCQPGDYRGQLASPGPR